jgi:hypothetical protein
LWSAGADLVFAVAGLVAAVYAQLKLKRAVLADPALVPLLVHPKDPVSRLAVSFYALGWGDTPGFAYVGLTLAGIAGGCSVTCLVLPRSSILTRWSSVLIGAAALLAGCMSYAVLVWSGSL